MSELSDEDLEQWANPPMLDGDRDILSSGERAEIRAMVAELQRRRAEDAETRRVSREDRLRDLGFEDQSDGQRREQLARIVTGREHVERVVREACREALEDFELHYRHPNPDDRGPLPDVRSANIEVAIPVARAVADRLSVEVEQATWRQNAERVVVEVLRDGSVYGDHYALAKRIAYRLSTSVPWAK